ncbi:hypothetical protein CDL15_Pgr015607 [Punica granatum]|uniref:Uncharacterized protein n=1 Tax=Punica granatum TaxID=22663 RepID=A0A218XQN1_PUNGR|nr:hypothetical protein CDL15_Pgr015607 [Punica granatum]
MTTHSHVAQFLKTEHMYVYLVTIIISANKPLQDLCDYDEEQFLLCIIAKYIEGVGSIRKNCGIQGSSLKYLTASCNHPAKWSLGWQCLKLRQMKSLRDSFSVNFNSSVSYMITVLNLLTGSRPQITANDPTSWI